MTSPASTDNPRPRRLSGGIMPSARMPGTPTPPTRPADAGRTRDLMAERIEREARGETPGPPVGELRNGDVVWPGPTYLIRVHGDPQRLVASDICDVIENHYNVLAKVEPAWGAQ